MKIACFQTNINIQFSEKMSCRLCLKRSDKMACISFNEQLQNRIKEFLQLDVTADKDLPNKICSGCLDKLEDYSTFKSMSWAVDRILKNARKDGNLHLFIELKSTENEDNVLSKTNDSDTMDEFDNQSDISDPHWEESKDVEEITIVKDEPGSSSPLEKPHTDKSETKELYSCKICNEAFKDPIGLAEHQQFRHQEIFLCYVCRTEFKSNEDLLNHVKTHLTINVATLNDSVANELFRKMKNDKTLSNTSDTCTQDKIKCPVCAKEILPLSLKNHLNSHSDRFKCKVCSAKFCSRSSLKVHAISVHSKIKDHVCDECGKEFSTVGLLRIHLKSHSNVRMYKCKLCDYAGKTGSALRIHTFKHKESTHLCDMCPKTFKSGIRLRIHRRVTHFKERKVFCEECGVGFINKSTLAAHFRIHTGEKPFICEICSKPFRRQDALKEHQRIHQKVA